MLLLPSSYDKFFFDRVFSFFMYLFVYSGQADKDFRVEVEAIGHVRHKNLVRLLGYCIEGTQRSDFFSCSFFDLGTKVESLSTRPLCVRVQAKSLSVTKLGSSTGYVHTHRS